MSSETSWGSNGWYIRNIKKYYNQHGLSKGSLTKKVENNWESTKKNTAGMNFEVVFDDFDDLSLLLSCFIPKICCLEVTKSLGSTFGSMLGVIYVRAFRLFSRTNLRHS
jgi:hypothetical protein